MKLQVSIQTYVLRKCIYAMRILCLVLNNYFAYIWFCLIFIYVLFLFFIFFQLPKEKI